MSESIDKVIDSLNKRLKDYCWFIAIGEGSDNKLLIYVKKNGLYEKRILNSIMKEYTDNYDVIKLSNYSPGDRNV